MTNKWQTIKTAPKDGTRILLYCEGCVIEGYFYQNYTRKGWDVVILSSHGCGCCSGDLEEPTHWMPLPQPPEED